MAIYGLVVDKVSGNARTAVKNAIVRGIHRDNYYGFWFMKEGAVKIMVDFKTHQIKAPAMFCVMPGQVHEGISIKNVAGWFVAANVNMIPDHVRAVFEESLVPVSPVSLNEKQATWLSHCAALLQETYANELASGKDKTDLLRPLLNAYTTMVSSIFTQHIQPEKVEESRAFQLTRQFRILVRQQFKTVKSPSAYARQLNISAGYLTEIVKNVSGYSVSYWIQQEIMTEAKRLLFYTELTIKEIAHELGYSDHAYFSRLFTTLAESSASIFRQKSRK